MEKEKVKKGCGFCGCLVVFAVLFAVLAIGVLLHGIAELDKKVSSQKDESEQEIREIACKKLGNGQDSGSKLVIIDIKGIMVTEKAAAGVCNSEDIIAQIDKAEADPDAAGIILNLNTPGGEVNAADDIYYRLMTYRRNTQKPVVAMMNGLAASGGYYAASACNKIIAGKNTITGSIGVIISTYNFYGLFHFLGIESEVYKSGPMKDMLNAARPRTRDEEAIVQDLVNSTFNEFLKIVSASRNIPVEELKESPSCDGRILSAQQALSYKLIDKIGRMPDAVRIAEELAGMEAGKCRVVRYERELSFIESLFSSAARSADRKVVVQLPGGVPEQTAVLQPGRLYFLPSGF